MRVEAVIRAALALALITAPAAAQTVQLQACQSRADLVAKLQGVFGETRQAFGIAGRGAVVVELYASPGGSWTIIMTTPEGRACGVASGQDWQTDPDAKLPPNL